MSQGRVTAKRRLGQHFLVDDNILGVIGRLADLQPDDVVLEIGPGLGVLTGYLAERVSRVIAVEIDRSLEPQLTERLAGRANVELLFGDALSRPRIAHAVAAQAGRQPAVQRGDADRGREP